MPTSPWLRAGLYVIRARPPEAYQKAVATELRMECRYQRSRNVGLKAVVRGTKFPGLPR